MLKKNFEAWFNQGDYRVIHKQKIEIDGNTSTITYYKIKKKRVDFRKIIESKKRKWEHKRQVMLRKKLRRELRRAFKRGELFAYLAKIFDRMAKAFHDLAIWIMTCFSEVLSKIREMETPPG